MSGGLAVLCLSLAATDAATLVRMQVAVQVPVSTPSFAAASVSPRSNVAAAPANAPSFVTTTEPAPAIETTRAVAEPGAEPSTTAAAEPAATAEPSAPSAPAPRRRGRTARIAPAPAPAAAPGAKGGMAPAPEQITYEDPGALRFSVEGGWSNVYLWRGVDLVQFTSYNYLATQRLKKADSDIWWLGVSATVQGFGLGVKYVESFEDDLNPFYAPTYDDLDNYSEWILTASYTRSLVPDNWLDGTVGFDFIYYPNGEFWGVDHQGMAYLKFRSPHYAWFQPFLDLFYNVATTDDGQGLADMPSPGFRGATGSELVEGGGFELGFGGGDVIYANDTVSWGLGYSVSTIYKSGYAFEDDGFSHLVFTVSSPVNIGKSFTITPSVSYVEGLGDISDPRVSDGAGGWVILSGAGDRASAWNEPGWIATVKATWTF